jgi:hypothetical protein
MHPSAGSALTPPSHSIPHPTTHTHIHFDTKPYTPPVQTACETRQYLQLCGKVCLHHCHHWAKQLLEYALILPEVQAEQELTAGRVNQQLVHVAKYDLDALEKTTSKGARA